MVRFGLHAASSLIVGEGGIPFPTYSVQDFNLFRALRWTGKFKNDVVNVFVTVFHLIRFLGLFPTIREFIEGGSKNVTVLTLVRACSRLISIQD